MNDTPANAAAPRANTAGADTGSSSMKPRHLGIGFVWAWIYCCFSTNLVFPNASRASISIDGSWLISAISIIAFMALFAVAWRKNAPKQPIRTTWVGAVVICCGTLLSAANAAALVPAALASSTALASGILTGLGTALLHLLWAEALLPLGREVAERAISLSAAITAFCALTAPVVGMTNGQLGHAFGTLFVTLLPLLCGICLSRTFRLDGSLEQGEIHTENSACPGKSRRCQQNGSRQPDRGPVKALVRAAVALFLFYLVISCAEAMLASQIAAIDAQSPDIATIIGVLFGLAVSLAFIAFSRKTDFFSIFRWLVPVAVAAMTLLPWDTPLTTSWSAALRTTCDVALQCIAYLCALELARRGALRAIPAVAVTQGGVQLGVLAGNVLGLAVAPAAPVSHNACIAAFAMTFTLSLITLLVSPYRHVKSASPAADAECVVAPSANATAASAPVSPFASACASISEQYGLSSREEEVLVLLSQGRSQPFIRDELVLSKNTVASHVKHIYQKLGVHSKQEVIDMAQQRMEQIGSAATN